ncbi:golvesin C-terminal-like domain-containing protein [Streptomyces chartreusis]|uniref:golvesin C-terminal-like domain-containing protein n=1 Tax=Streptomyces chartreusis TaxID=1969 RepID=UPI0037A4AB08
MRSHRRARTPLALIVAGGMVSGLLQASTAWADDPPNDSTAVAAAKPTADSVPPSDRAELLGKDYEESADIAWTTTSDAQGFHLLTATEKSGYTWKTLASLAEPGFDADQWIGNVCVTGSGKRAVVVYAPRSFTNNPKLMARGGFTAVVDLATGAVSKLKVNASLSYYNPGCGIGEEAVLTQSPGEDKKQTRLIRVNTATAGLSKPVVVEGQITSSVPAGDGRIAAASGRALVEIDAKGRKEKLAATGTVPYRISKDSAGGYLYLERVQRDELKQKETALVRRWADRKVTELGSGPLGDTGLTRLGGQVYLTGGVEAAKNLPSTVTRLAGTDKDATLSTKGSAIVQETEWADGKGSPRYLQPDTALDARPVNITATIRDSGEKTGFTVTPLKDRSPQWETSRTPSPMLPGTESGTDSRSGMRSNPAAPRAPGDVTGTRTEIVESERTCSVPRNDPRNQAMQPKPRQVEWAVNKAVTGKLNTGASRPANWKNLGMPAYAPQTLFAPPALEGGGRVPAQVLLGITTQESNMWQAARSAVPGVTGNPLIGNYYGIDYYDGNSDNDWDVDWSEADCGYGVTQVTDHMRMAGREHGKGGTAWPYDKQRAVALDYAANVAAGLQILVSKWNQTRKAGLKVHDGSPDRLENWFFALWAYNSGFYENVNGNEPWGVGWANNPANPEWDAGRTPFMEDRLGNESPSDAARPQNWPYPEKVLGFAAHPPSFIESPGNLVAAFRPAWWNGTTGDATIEGSDKYHRARVKPPEDLFCGAYNWCDPSKISDGASNDVGNGPCNRSDSKCWWHQSVQWKTDCDYSCGNELFRFPSPDYDAEQADGTAYAPNCARTGLPSGSLIIDDLPGGTPSVRPGCSNTTWSNEGTFSLDFGDGEAGLAHDGQTISTVWPAKVDLHQLGAGFGGHFYFGHDRAQGAKAERLKMTGSWTLNQAVNGPAKIWVHLPDHGAQVKYAAYKVHTAKGVRTRIVNQNGSSNRWVPIGAFMFNAKPKVTLSNITQNGTGDKDIAYDAIAVQPIDGKFVERNLTAAAIFDPNQDLNGNLFEVFHTPIRTMTTMYNWAMGLAYRGPRWDNTQVDTEGITSAARCPTVVPVGECSGQRTYDAAKKWYEDIKAGGLTPRADGSAPSMSIPVWMAMSNQRPDPSQPASVALKSDNSYKIKSDVEVSFIVDNTTGKIISGSESAGYQLRIGNAHLPHFVTDIIQAIESDYGITKPDIDYTTYDALEYGRDERVHPYTDGDTPGQVLFPHFRGARLNSDNTCVDFRAVGGGVHGYRPMIAYKHINDNVKAWVDRVRAHTETNVMIRNFAGDIYSMFFKNDGGNNATGSMLGNAPPIWQDIAAAFCADGSVKPTHKADNGDAVPPNGIVYQSYMPDLYLYIDDRMTDNLGRPSNGRAKSGDWRNFSNLPIGNGHAYSRCDVSDRGSGGNPWGIEPPMPLIGDGPGQRPGSVVHCDEPGVGFSDSITP